MRCIADIAYQALNNEPTLNVGDRQYIHVCKKCLQKECTKHPKLILHSNL